ncbi:MAG: glycerol-3-phosphate dehydrogenase/oxidase [Anaerolineae bacterium]|nr:glycerol-3-phosphate dehydrogenase/oxidase [Anaerolineae bacterium]MCO5188299.1 glycerol-3-phosphate dehydrogenase/oxidase [Anaerolineae bacterium]MCO5195265.1 glycerol-3-phosphate dehydrogenase/oxidase [Anaerolineae bacterium]
MRINNPLYEVMWTTGWRDTIWSDLDQNWDIIVIGGGITGAGILREAVRLGLRVLLLEKHDFASGTSSRSSKLVHGGLRYLRNAQVRLTYESVRERERLLNEGYGLVAPLKWLMADYEDDAMPGWMFSAGLLAYDLMALRWDHSHFSAETLHQRIPSLRRQKLEGGFLYSDAQTDDARLTLRVIGEGVRAGGTALNYANVVDLLRDADGQICGVAVQDQAPDGNGRTAEVQAGVVISATGAWADDLRVKLNRERKIRPLQGSHLTFSAERIAVPHAISFMHPVDKRPVFALPWEGVTIFGTTDIDSGTDGAIPDHPAITSGEADYLLEGIRWAFPDLDLSEQDVIGTFAGVRPVVATGQSDPSKESREHVLWQEDGLLTVTGGKLTTFRVMAQAALKQVRKRLPVAVSVPKQARLFDMVSAEFVDQLPPQTWARLLGRYGADTNAMLCSADVGECESIADLPSVWCELRWAARAEGVVRLEDLLLRRVRLGFTLRNGGLDQIGRIRTIVQPELGWSDAKWQAELAAYAQTWQRAYAYGAVSTKIGVEPTVSGKT